MVLVSRVAIVQGSSNFCCDRPKETPNQRPETVAWVQAVVWGILAVVLYRGSNRSCKPTTVIRVVIARLRLFRMSIAPQNARLQRSLAAG
jgi:hypothetical protein